MTISKRAGFAFCKSSSDGVEAFSSLRMTFRKCVILTLACKFLLEKFIDLQLLGSFMSLWNVQGPGPMKLAASSPRLLSSRRASGSSSSKRGEQRRTSGHEDSRGRIGVEFFPSFRTDRRLNRMGGSARISRWNREKYSTFSKFEAPKITFVTTAENKTTYPRQTPLFDELSLCPWA